MSNLILFYDTETTGFPDWKSPSGNKNQPHLVQLAAILANEETREVVSSIDVIIKPENWEIPNESYEIHGITKEHAKAVGVSEKLALTMFLELWKDRKRVSHNRSFDQRIIRIATKRYCADEVIDTWADKGSHDCSMLLAKPIMNLLSKVNRGYKNPTLEEAYKHFTGNELKNAHTAIADTLACMAVYWAIQDEDMPF